MTRKLMIPACLLVLIASALPMAVAAAKFNRKVDVGQKAPDWKDLKGTDDKPHSLADYKRAKVLVFTVTCNHCPVAQIYEERFNEFAKTYKEKGVEFVAVCCGQEPVDSFDEMKKRASEKKFTYPYLHDADQSVGRSYGASSTPQLFVLDGERKIAYMGAFDDNENASKVKHRYVLDAVDSLLAGSKPEVTETRPRGCGIVYPEK